MDAIRKEEIEPLKAHTKRMIDLRVELCNEQVEELKPLKAENEDLIAQKAELKAALEKCRATQQKNDIMLLKLTNRMQDVMMDRYVVNREREKQVQQTKDHLVQLFAKIRKWKKRRGASFANGIVLLPRLRYSVCK